MARVLVCEDEPDILALIVARLGRDGFEVVTATDGADGLRLALDVSPDVVIVDWMMPGLNGLELCAALREHPETRSVPIIMLTARAQQSDIDAAFAAGVDDFVIKPFRAGELQARVTGLLARA